MTPVENLAVALAALERHARDMASRDEHHHDDCLWCNTAVLLSRVTAWGKTERDIQLQELRK